MIGFFAHQYLSFKENHLANLIALAKIDGHLHDEEAQMLYKIGAKYGLKDKQIAKLIDNEEAHEISVPDSHEHKMNQLYDLVMMVHADNVVEDSEVLFCEDLADKFGFKREVIQWLIAAFEKGNPPAPEVWDDIKNTAASQYIA